MTKYAFLHQSQKVNERSKNDKCKKSRERERDGE